MLTRIGITVYWLLSVVIILVIIPVGMFVVPPMAPGWKAQGLTEVPLFWQVLVDLADFFFYHWWFWFLPYIAVGAWLTRGARKQNA